MFEDEESIEEQAQREQDKQESKMDEYLNDTIVRQGKNVCMAMSGEERKGMSECVINGWRVALKGQDIFFNALREAGVFKEDKEIQK